MQTPVPAHMKGSAPVSVLLALMMTIPLIGTISPVTMPNSPHYPQFVPEGSTAASPTQIEMPIFGQQDSWEHTTLDSNHNNIHDSLESALGRVNVGLSYDSEVTMDRQRALADLGYTVRQVIDSVDAVLLGDIDPSEIWTLAQLDGVVMVERYGVLTFYGDVQTPAVKARNSSLYAGAWDLGVSGKGVNIALVDTGVDNEHPGLTGKFVAGYDAVCYVHSDPSCVLAGGRVDDGSFDPDDGNQHGTACMGMAAATGMEPDGSQSNYTGSAPDAGLVDVRIGTDVGAGPFENYLLEQEFYESAMNGLQWIIDHRDDAWPGVDEESHGIDIISLSWGITSHENGGSDGTDMHSRILDDAMLAGVTVSNAAGNDGPDNDGLSGMSASSLSITVAATDDKNTIDRSDDTIASYSSRGPRRDNGDSNPLDELVPEISAPGTNIVQAEGCVTSGGCNNNIPGQDASDNTYTGRGSGTSYATPAVTGVIALVMEANPDLEPLQIKEVLKQTAERRGPASAPTIDPFWNRDFGYGMVDAYAAVELAQHLSATNQSSSIDPYLQNHLSSVNVSGSEAIITGLSWAQQGVIDRVEFRFEGGEWQETTYEELNGSNMTSTVPFTWTIGLNVDGMSAGNHTVEIRAVSGDMTSLPVLATVTGTGLGMNTSSSPIVFLSVGVSIVLILIIGFVAWKAFSTPVRMTMEDEPLEAELVEAPSLEGMTVTQLKELAREQGVPVSGTKAQLIERLS